MSRPTAVDSSWSSLAGSPSAGLASRSRPELERETEAHRAHEVTAPHQAPSKMPFVDYSCVVGNTEIIQVGTCS
jgi:hypothetical protein